MFELLLALAVLAVGGLALTHVHLMVVEQEATVLARSIALARLEETVQCIESAQECPLFEQVSIMPLEQAVWETPLDLFIQKHVAASMYRADQWQLALVRARNDMVLFAITQQRNGDA